MRTLAPAIPYSALPAPDRYAGRLDRGEIQLTARPADPIPVVFAHQYLTILDDPVTYPSGESRHYLRIFQQNELRGLHPTVMVPTFGDEVFFVRLFRHPVRRWSLEFPRGFAESDVSASQNARLETRQELGVRALDAIEIGTIAPNTGLLATRARVFHVPLAGRPRRRPRRPTQKNEAIVRVVPVPRVSFTAGLRRGDGALSEIICGFTLAAILQSLAKGILT